MPSQDLLALGLTEEEQDLSTTVDIAEEEENAVIGAEAPQGDFTPAGFKPLIRNLNELLPLFDAEPYPEITEPTNVWPDDLTRVMLMVETAVNDAIDAQEIDAGKAVEMAGVSTDADLKLLASKIRILSADKAFKKFLTQSSEGEPIKETPQDVLPTPTTRPSDEDMESLFNDRI